MKRFFPAWIFPLLIAFSVGTVWLRLAAVRSSYAINKADRMISSLRAEREKAELKLAQLRSPKRLERLARERFRLQPPTTAQLIRLEATRL